MSMHTSILLDDIRYEWLGQSTVRITGKDGFTIYTDPVELDNVPPKADLILITHHHVDHCLIEFVNALRDASTRLAAFHDSYMKYCVQDIKGVRTVKVGQTIDLLGVSITGIDAYTTRGFHTKGEGCGFLIEINGCRIYFSGDTGAINEMKALRDIDVAIVSICDNIHAIDPCEIIEAVKEMHPKLFIPVHFTPLSEPDPEPPKANAPLYTKDPRFFTSKEDPNKLIPFLKGTGIEVAILKKLGKPEVKLKYFWEEQIK